MKSYVASILAEWQTEIVAFLGLMIHALLRRDVPWLHHAAMLFLGLPLTVYVIAPGLSSWLNLSLQTEKAIVFVLAFWGRDLLIGFSKLAKQFGQDPNSLLRKK